MARKPKRDIDLLPLLLGAIGDVVTFRPLFKPSRRFRLLVLIELILSFFCVFGAAILVILRLTV